MKYNLQCTFFNNCVTIFISGESQEDKEKKLLSPSKDTGSKTSRKGVVEKQPTAIVVGIIRRKWRQYCGIIRRSEFTMVSNEII